MSSKLGKSSLLRKNQFKKALQETNNSQENVLGRLQTNSDSKLIDSLTEEKHLETLNNLENNDLENSLQNTLYLLDIEYNKLLKVEENSKRDLERLKNILSQDIKQQRLNYTQSLLSNRDSNSGNSVPDEVVLKAERLIQLKLEHGPLLKQLDSLKQSLRPYEDIPDSIELVQDKVREMENELKSLEQQISNAYCNTSLNESM